MIPKLIFPDAFDFGMPAASLVPIHSRGVDKGFIKKRAALFDNCLDDFERKPGYSYIHLISVGALERYGANNNGDGFNKTASRHTAPHPAEGCAATVSLDGGLLKFHNTCFEKHAAVYQHHQNKHKKGKATGYIVKAAYNEDMDRGELLAGVEDKVWGDDLHKLASSKPVYFSMGCDCPSDLCSYCHTRASAREDYCEHLKSNMLMIDKLGNQVCAVTDIPLFHDISKVVRPAEKISFGLRKVATAGGVISGAELAEIYGLTPRVETVRKFMSKKATDRYALLKKLAEIEKELLLAPAGSPAEALIDGFRPESGFGEVDDSTITKLSAKSPEALFGALKNKLVILPFDVFLKIIMGSRLPEVESHIQGAKQLLPGILGRLLEDPTVDSFLGDSSYEGAPTGAKDLAACIGSMGPTCSLNNEPVRMRTIRAVLRAEPNDGPAVIVKESASTGSGTAEDVLAREYVRYLLSFADGLSKHAQDLTVAQMLANVY